MSVIKKISKYFKINKFFILLFFICILTGYFEDAVLFFLFTLLHELCHVAFAYILKIKIKNIELFPFGGIAKIDNLDYMGTYKEIMISAAGPLFNGLMAAFLLLINKLGIIIPKNSLIININVILALFNLLPGLPLDGGRILRAVLNYFIGFKKSTKTAVISGKIIAVIIFILGLALLIYGKLNISFLIMPFFIFYALRQEESIMMFMIIKDMINKKRKFLNSGLMEGMFICAFEDTFTEDIIKYIDLDRYHIIIVIDKEMKIKGFLTESQLINDITLNEDITVGKLIDILCRMNDK